MFTSHSCYKSLLSGSFHPFHGRSENMYDEAVYLPIYDTAYGISFIFDDEEELRDRDLGNCEWPQA